MLCVRDAVYGEAHDLEVGVGGALEGHPRYYFVPRAGVGATTPSSVSLHYLFVFGKCCLCIYFAKIRGVCCVPPKWFKLIICPISCSNFHY